MNKGKKFNGHCPLCRSQLRYIDEETAVCPIGDYSVKVKEYNEIWEKYEPYLKQGSTVVAEELLNELKNANTKKREGE